MIIKGNKNKGNQPSGESTEELVGKDAEKELKAHAQKPKEPEPVWTPEAVESGKLPDRRQTDRRLERRQDYRRIEDKELISKAQELVAVLQF